MHKIKAFEIYGKMWIPLVAKNIAQAFFSFPSLSAYQDYHSKATSDLACQGTMAYYEQSRIHIISNRLRRRASYVVLETGSWLNSPTISYVVKTSIKT